MKFNKILTLVFSLALFGTNFNLSSMENEASRRAALIEKLKSDPVDTLHYPLYLHLNDYNLGNHSPSVEVIAPWVGGSHGLPEPKSPIKKDARFRSITQPEKLRLESYSREQIKSHLRSQWEQIQFYEKYLAQTIPIKGHDRAYESFEEFALDNFSLYQCDNFLEYFKTLPGYEHAVAKLNEMRNTKSKSLGSTVKSATRKVASWLQPGIDWARDKKHENTSDASVIDSRLGSGSLQEAVVGTSSSVDTNTSPIFPSFPAKEGEIDGYVNKFMSQFPGRGIPGFIPGDDLGIFKGFGSLPGTSSTVHTGTGGLVDPSMQSPIKKIKLRENTPTVSPAVIPGPADKEQPSLLKEGLKAAGVGLLKETPGIINSLLKLYSGFHQQQPVVQHQFSFSSSQQQRGPVHAGLMPPSAKFIPPLAQFSSQPQQNFFAPQPSGNKRPFQEISSLESSGTTFIDEDIIALPTPQLSPTTTPAVMTEQELDSMMEAEGVTFTENQHSDLSTMNEDIGTEGPVVTLQDGTQIDINHLNRLVDKDKEINDRVRAQIEGKPEQQHAGIICNMVDGMSEMVESILDRYRQRASLTDEQEMLEFALIMQKTERYIVRGAERLKNGIVGGARDWENLVVTNMKLANLLVNGEKREFPFYWAGDSRGRDAAEKLFQRSVEQQKQFDECVDRIKKMSWGDLVEGGAYLGTHIALDGASLFILKKLPSAGGKFLSGLNKYSKAAKAEETIAVASKGLSIANQCGLDTAIGVKLATEYGTDGAAKIFKIIEQHPEILKQEGKNIVQVVQEVAEQSHLRPNPGYRPPEPHSSTPVFGKNFGIEVNTHRQFKPTMIYGREYSGHTLQRMTERGLTPLTIENVIKSGQVISDVIPGRLDCYDKINNVTAVICGKTGNVITIFFGKPAGLR